MAADRRLLAAAFAAISFLTAGPARGAIARPVQTAPNAGALSQFLPVFAWSPVARADRYEFQVSADSGMNSPVLGHGYDDFFTKNTRATLIKTVPNGTYYWRVRSVTADGAVSPWTSPRSFKKQWTAAASLQNPASGSSIVFPSSPLRLGWTPVPGAANYQVYLATDPLLGTLVVNDTLTGGSGPPTTQATTFTRAAALPAGSYYWGVVPVDAEGNHGTASPVASFSWVWPSTTTPQITDLNSALEVFDPFFSWDAVPGAGKYEVEVNSSVDFAPGSKVCCTAPTTATSLAPTGVFKDNVYYWRVRAIDPDENAGVWNYGPSFTKTFDNVPPVTAPSVKHLHMRDNADDPGTDLDPGTAGYQTQVPIVTWDPVPGAASYEVDVAPFESGTCNWTALPSDHHWRITTAVPAWTPLGHGWNNVKPYPDALSVANDGPIGLAVGSYCARVRARTDRDTAAQDVYGDYTYLDDGTGTAFTWTGYPPAASLGCNSGYLCAADYLTPILGSLNRRTPYFTWKPMAGAQSYFVLVSKDASFTHIVDYGFTQIPAYAPRTASAPRTYSDETTSYYWAVLPAQSFNGGLAAGNPLLSAPSNFQKQSLPPTLMSPAEGTQFLGQPTFRWSAVEGARRYRLQIAQDPTFGDPIDDLVTDSTAFSSSNTYPADTVLYWRVRADDENLVGLTWSATGTFQKKLAVPVPDPSNPTAGETLPSWNWSPIDGAVSYDFSLDVPDGTHKDINGLRMPVLTPILLWGTGVWHWKVRANFPKASSGTVPGPYSPVQTFTRTIGEPGNARTDSARDHVLLTWDPRLGAKDYRVQVSDRPDFGRVFDNVTTDNTSYAPAMTKTQYAAGGSLYWRVAARDAGRNEGDWTQVQQIRLQPRMRLVASGSARKGRRSRIQLKVLDANGHWLTGVTVKASGGGVRRTAKRTNVVGRVTFSFRPRKRGKLLFTASKPGFQPAYASVRVR
jgi:hypothetical protein